jgi:hypothetical protein
LSKAGGQNYMLGFTFAIVATMAFVALVFFWRKFSALTSIIKLQD